MRREQQIDQQNIPRSGARRRRLGLLLALSGFAAAGPARAEPTAASVDAVLSALHTEEFLDEATMLLDQAMQRRKKEGTLPEAQLTAIQNFAKRIYQGKNLLTVFKPAYTKAINRDDLAAFYAWLNSPAGIKLRQGYGGIVKNGDGDRLRAFTAAPASGKANRINTLNTFANLWRQVDLFASFQAGMNLGLTTALNAYEAPATRLPLKTLRDNAYRLKPAYDKPAREYFKVFDYTLLKDLKNEDVDALGQFAMTRAGEAHTKAYIKALEYTLEGAAYTLGQQVLKVQQN